MANESSIVILYLEDNPDDQTLVQMAAKRAGTRFELRMVSSVSGGTDYLEHNPPFTELERNPPADLVLLDFSLDGGNGITFLRWVRSQAQFKELPVIVYSSTQHPTSIRDAYEAGATAFLEKSADFGEIVNTFQRLEECFQTDPPSFEPLRSLPNSRAPEGLPRPQASA